MNIDSLTNKDDIVLLAEQFKMGLTTLATGGIYDNNEYQRIRKLLLANTSIENIIPRFLKICRNANEFWRWIKNEKPTYEERRILLSELLNPIIEAFEYENGEASLEFQKNYKEIEIIGNGGFGLVYKYEHLLLKLPFAVKVFAPAFYEEGSNEKELERFFQEARILFTLNHPNIIRIYDAGMIGKRPFIRMEYFEGKNLNQILLEFGSLNLEKSLIAMKNIISAIDYAHDQGIIHRDLKPSNIMASVPNQFRVIDFGLGIFIENELYSRLTKTGNQTISGYYNAPELISNPRLIDKRSDIYSLGAIWYTLLCNQPPAGSNFMSILINMSVPKDILNIIEKCLNPINTRYKDCKELLDDILNL